MPTEPHDDPEVAKLPQAGLADRMRLESAFAPWRARVQRRIVSRGVLDGLTAGAALGSASTAALAVTHAADAHAALKLTGVALVLGGLAVGWFVGLRRRWSDEWIAMYVDGAEGDPETVTSAITLGRDASRPLIDEAIGVLTRSRRPPPRTLRRLHALAALGLVGTAAIFAVRPRSLAAPPQPVGSDVVKLEGAAGLDRIAEVEKLPARDEDQKKRLGEIAREARELKQKLLAGTPRREALAKLKDLRDRLENERKSLGAGDKQPGLDAAREALKANGFPGLGDALEDRDMAGFDEMMERIANAREESDRERAREALEKAIEAAKRQKAADVARELERQKDKLDKRGDKADVLRELADALKGTPGDPGQKGKSFDRSGSDGAARELADALRKGLEKLTPEERKRLAERMKERAEQGGEGGKMSGRQKKRLRDLADKLKTPEGQKELEERLKREAAEDPEDGEGQDERRRQRGLEDGEDGADDTGDQLGDEGKGKDGKGKDGKGKDGKGKDGKGKDGKGSGKDGKPGTGDGDGEGDGLSMQLPGGDPSDAQGGTGGGGDGKHDGKSKRVDAESLRAKAKGVGAHGTPLPGGSIERSAGSDGATAGVKGTGDLKGAAADQVSAVDRPEIPEGIRRQVKSYFE